MKKTDYMDIVYTDASCNHEQNIFSWAVITEHHTYAGTVQTKKAHSFYSELYAIYQALQLRKGIDNETIIYCDNYGVVSKLNKEPLDFMQDNDYMRKMDGDLMDKAYYLYQETPNIHIRKINRKDNQLSDRVAKRELARGRVEKLHR